MLKFYQKRYLYLNATLLKDPSTLQLLEEMAERHYPVYVYLHDVWQQETVKSLEAFAYICDVVYGDSMEAAVTAYAKKNQQKYKQILMLHGDNDLTASQIDAICIYDHACDMGQYLYLRHKSKRRRAKKLYATLALCLLYFIAYFLLLDHMPGFMVDGVAGMLFVLIPTALGMGCFAYGLYSDVFHWSLLLDLLDMI